MRCDDLSPICAALHEVSGIGTLDSIVLLGAELPVLRNDLCYKSLTVKDDVMKQSNV